MSRNSDAKKARRKKRQAARDARWIPDDVMENLLGEDFEDLDDDELDELEQAVEKLDEWLTLRGWTFDVDFSSDRLASWYFGPSATEFDEEAFEPVTRIWITLTGQDDDFPNRASVALVGTGGQNMGGLYTVSLEILLEHIDAIETYRLGDPVPVLG